MSHSLAVGGGRRRRDPGQLRLFDPSREEVVTGPSWRWPWADGELLCFDLETTGTDRFGDVPVSFALVRLRAGVVTERSVGIVNPGRPIPPAATSVHGITDEQAMSEGLPLADAIEYLATQLVDASRRRVPAVGVKLDYDLTMLDSACRGLDGRGLQDRGWRGPVLDALVLDRHVDRYRKGRRTLGDLCALYGVALPEAHKAECDAEAAGRVVLAMASAYRELAEASLNLLHICQMGAHRAWYGSLNEWRRTKGLPPLDPSEEDWPLGRPTPVAVGAA